MSRFRTFPSAPLRPYVAAYWGFARTFEPAHVFTITPDRFIELIFFDEPPCVRDGDRSIRLPACTLIPLLRAPLRLELGGHVRCVSIRAHVWSAALLGLRAYAARPFVDMTASPIVDVATVIAHLRAEDWSALTATFDAALLRRRAMVPLATSRDALGASASLRTVQRKVRSLTNLAPQEVASIERFERARDALWERPDERLADVAAACGYADQAHLARHFRRYADTTPTVFRARCKADRAFLAGEDVAIVQDVLPGDE